MGKPVEQVDRVIIRVAGDSGDGMQLTGDRFTAETAAFGNDLSTLPNFPAEIRAPAGTLPGVSSFQLHFADHDILTPGDAPNVLVAMNPAALKANLSDLPRGATLIVDTHDFSKRNLSKVGYASSPVDDGTLSDFHVHALDLTGMTLAAVEGLGLTRKEAARAKNMFALGLLSWMYGRPTEATEDFLAAKFATRPGVRDANLAAFRAGWSFGETTEDFAVSYEVKPAPLPAGTYRNISGNLALSYGLVAASNRAGLPLFLGSYPITPASDILHELARHKAFGVRTFQAEDEIAGIGAALGAAFGGALGVTTTSGPGVALKSETVGLAVSLELPLLVICDVQRGGPSTGLPTKTEQSDLLQVMFGRNGEAPVPIVAPVSGGLLRRRYRGGTDRADLPHAGAPALRRLPRQRLRALAACPTSTLPTCEVDFATEPNAPMAGAGVPALRPGPEQTLARPWALPGTAGPRAPHRRHGEGRPHRQRSPTTRTTTTDGAAAAGQGRRDRPDVARPWRSTTHPGEAQGARARAGAPRTGPIGPRRAARRRAGQSVAAWPTCATSTRSRQPGARCCAATTGCRPGDEPRAARAAAAGPLPRRRQSATTRSAGMPFPAPSWPGVIRGRDRRVTEAS